MCRNTWQWCKVACAVAMSQYMAIEVAENLKGGSLPQDQHFIQAFTLCGISSKHSCTTHQCLGIAFSHSFPHWNGKISNAAVSLFELDSAHSKGSCRASRNAHLWSSKTKKRNEAPSSFRKSRAPTVHHTGHPMLSCSSAVGHAIVGLRY